ncbi:uncharacterized protein LOC6620465 [Drosophila sechellia]|uniref:GD16075 n=3 Tax=melanogaster subgroup TaxID=32351 RepID=B4R6V8_DROSI|nr:uncharacterized protein LOC6620465 [Drosophila sechellia]XP_002106534.1 uncharacterized protein LOC6725521 isoform X1 [Drosophila simulans]XP_033171489.1 uncharacterized protein LOC117148285 [Drosophila mauritiana]EDW54743.1 GM22371 [Drosophila sechellia]EDX17488.1 GD16075 [Drosophila simulans]KMZ08933.1 uncharacterized protein Dsimw501_GD16075 [Drosophila simulans]
MSSGKILPRRQAVPVLYTRGTHYEVGFDMGRTFGSMIKNFLILSKPLNETYLPLYQSPKGRQIYNETLGSVKDSFPQYVRELEGVADGAEVEFHKLFLLHLDEILPQALKHQPRSKNQPTGCSTIIVNQKNCRLLGHTEDALTETLNHYYFVVAHIISDKPQGKYNVKEEHFMSLCYAGHLPGYTMSQNHHGLVFSINTISAELLRSGKTPRHFITRALLATSNVDDAFRVLKDAGVGAADACSINFTFLADPRQMCYNVEMAPSPERKNESHLNIKEVPLGEHNYHVNQFDRIRQDQANDLMISSSISRMQTFGSYNPPMSEQDVRHMLGDVSGGVYCVWRENNSCDEVVKTIAVGIFDLSARTISLYSDNPSETEPHCRLPLLYK